MLRGELEAGFFEETLDEGEDVVLDFVGESEVWWKAEGLGLRVCGGCGWGGGFVDGDGL